MVPMRATASRRNDLDATKCGKTVSEATLDQSGWPRIAAIGYAMNTSVNTKKTRSA